MRYTILGAELREVDTDEHYRCPQFSPAVHNAFRKVMGLIRAAADDRDLRKMKSLHLEKLSGRRRDQYSLRLNKQFRLILRFEEQRQGRNVVVIEIVDYH